jgi:hypothetical protein
LSKILEGEKATNPAELKHKKFPVFIYKQNTVIDVTWDFSDYKMILGRQSCRLKSETILNVFVKDTHSY